jgi:hypothetical protein
VNLEEPFATVSTTLITLVLDEARLLIEFKGHFEVGACTAHLLLRQESVGYPIERH